MKKQLIEPVILAEDVLKKLEEMYPDKQPRKELTQFEQGKLIGCQEVIDYIRSL